MTNGGMYGSASCLMLGRFPSVSEDVYFVTKNYTIKQGWVFVVRKSGKVKYLLLGMYRTQLSPDLPKGRRGRHERSVLAVPGVARGSQQTHSRFPG